MFMSAMTFRRVVTAEAIARGAVEMSWRTPSIRYRIRRFSAVGSTWMSDARSLRAWRMRRFTYRTIGASSTTAWMLPRSSSPRSSKSDAAAVATSLASPPWWYALSM